MIYIYMNSRNDMYVCWIAWPQVDIWEKKYPSEMNFLFGISPSARQIGGEAMVWNYFPTPNKVEVIIYDPETIVAFKLKFGNV